MSTVNSFPTPFDSVEPTLNRFDIYIYIHIIYIYRERERSNIDPLFFLPRCIIRILLPAMEPSAEPSAMDHPPRSPTWIIPISQFVDQNCLVFEDQEDGGRTEGGRRVRWTRLKRFCARRRRGAEARFSASLPVLRMREAVKC